MANSIQLPANSIIIVMGVCGSGKSTVARLIARQLGAQFKDGDELHPISNINKMKAGHSLTDEDRLPWLKRIQGYAINSAAKSGACVVACSALKCSYRELLNQAGNVNFVYLHGTRELIQSRMMQRADHFMPETMLDSQLSTLETPINEPNVVAVNVQPTPAEISDKAISKLAQLINSVGESVTAQSHQSAVRNG